MRLDHILQPERIAILPDCQDGDALLAHLARLLTLDAPEQSAAIAQSLHQRERLGSTAIGHGVALPHGRNSLFDEARAAFVRLPVPIDYRAHDGEPVDLALALSVPAHFTHQHLQLIAGIAERLGNAELRQALRSASDSTRLHALLTCDTP